MEKLKEIYSDDSCLNKAKDNEMLFVLRGQDMTSPQVILEWIKVNFNHLPEDKLNEAFNCALKMKETKGRKMPD